MCQGLCRRGPDAGPGDSAHPITPAGQPNEMGFAATVLQRWALSFSKFIPKVTSVSSPSRAYRWPPAGAPGSLPSSYPSCFLPTRVTGKYQGQGHVLGSQGMALLPRSMKNNNYHMPFDPTPVTDFGNSFLRQSQNSGPAEDNHLR